MTVGNLTKNGLGSMFVWGATVFPKRLLSIFYLAGSFKKPNRAFHRSIGLSVIPGGNSMWVGVRRRVPPAPLIDNGDLPFRSSLFDDDSAC